jgi:CubicO group peptidase (beta-lactamase class C family)
MKLLVAICALLSFILPAMSQPDEKAIDSLFAEFSQPGAPGAAVMVIKDSKVVVAKGYGLANLETGVACATNTNFRLASFTKQFTAMSILILDERGKLSLDDSITKYLSGLPAWAKEITIRHLLTHTSGLIAYEDVIPATMTAQLKDKDVLELLRKETKTYFTPGTKFHYSNTGYAFLALIVEKVSGQTFAQFLHANIFAPLGMNNTVAYESGISTVPNRALGYSKTKDGFDQTDQSQTSAVLGDGGIYSSIADLYQWDQALYTEKLVSRKTLQQAYTPGTHPTDVPGSFYGFGWYIDHAHETQHVSHDGGTCGFSTRIERYPEKKLTVIILVNRHSAPVSTLGPKVVDLYW